MKVFLLVVAALLLLLHAWREYWARRTLPRVQTAVFDGKLLRVGETTIAYRPARNGSDKSIICFPGFLEDMRYFQALYSDADCELILVNNARYHCAFDGEPAPLEFAANPYRVGTIEYDGFLLGEVLSRLATGRQIVLHGHSRGGAVVLECGRQYPELVRSDDHSVSAILEAPVVPGGRMVGKGSETLPHHLICYFLPVVLGLLRSADPQRMLRQPMMRPNNPLKQSICSGLYVNARDYATCVTNVKSIRRWQAEHTPELFRAFDSVQVVLGARDDVLDNAAIRASAEAGRALNPAVEIVETVETNHFPSLEQPAGMRALAGVGPVPALAD